MYNCIDYRIDMSSAIRMQELSSKRLEDLAYTKMKREEGSYENLKIFKGNHFIFIESPKGDFKYFPKSRKIIFGKIDLTNNHIFKGCSSPEDIMKSCNQYVKER